MKSITLVITSLRTNEGFTLPNKEKPGVRFVNMHKWKTHQWNPHEPRIRCKIFWCCVSNIALFHTKRGIYSYSYEHHNYTQFLPPLKIKIPQFYMYTKKGLFALSLGILINSKASFFGFKCHVQLMPQSAVTASKRWQVSTYFDTLMFWKKCKQKISTLRRTIVLSFSDKQEIESV